MAITNGYATLDGYKARYGIEDNDDDATIEAIITAVSREIDTICWDRFYTTSTDETRYFTPIHADYLKPKFPIVSLTTLKTDRDGDRTYETTWATTDYDLHPFDASMDSEPYRWIELTPNGDYSFPKIARGVEIVGKFGWSSIPSQISEACYLGAHRIMKRQDTPLGVSAAATLGQLQIKVTQLRADPDFMMLIKPFIVGA
jgi:hypothetical protein